MLWVVLFCRKKQGKSVAVLLARSTTLLYLGIGCNTVKFELKIKPLLN